MTRTLASLCALGAVVRLPDSKDGRRIVVTITEEGRTMLGQARHSRDAWMFERVRELSEQDCDVLRRAQQILQSVVAR